MQCDKWSNWYTIYGRTTMVGKSRSHSGETSWHFQAVGNTWRVLMCPPELLYIHNLITQLSLHLPLIKNLVSMWAFPTSQGKGICPLASYITQSRMTGQALPPHNPPYGKKHAPLRLLTPSLCPPGLCYLPTFWSLPALIEDFGLEITVFSNPSQQFLLELRLLSAAMETGVVSAS